MKLKLWQRIGITLITISCFCTIFTIYQKYSENSIDSKDEVLHNIEYDIENSGFELNQNYYKIINEAEKRRLLAEQKERLRKLEEERKRKAELERQRLARIEQKKREKEKFVVSRGDSNQVASDWMVFEATYYTPYCEGCSGISKTGINTRKSIYYNGYKIIAVDPKKIPLMSLVEVVTPYETFKAVAGDIGSDIKGNRVDILVSTKQEAYKLGRHNVQLRVIKYGNK